MVELLCLLLWTGISISGVYATDYFGGSTALLQCTRPPGTSLNEDPVWILNQTLELRTVDPQKYAVDDERLQLSVLDLQYEDAGQYWCRFSSGNSSAGSIEIRGRPVFSCGAPACREPSECVLSDYSKLSLDLAYTFSSFGMAVGVGARPTRFSVKQSVGGVETTVGMCSVEAGLCEASGRGINFTATSASSLVAVVDGSSLASGNYTATGFYRDVDGTEVRFTKTIEVTIRSCGSLSSFMGNVSTARVNQCNVTYTCPGDQDDPENRTALCLEGSSAWQGLGCPALHPTTPGEAMTSTGLTGSSSSAMPLPTTTCPSSMLTPSPTMATSSTMEAPKTASVLAAALVSVGVVVAIVVVVIVTVIAAVALLRQSRQKSSVVFSVSNSSVHEEIEEGSEKEKLHWENPNRDSIISTPENDMNLPDVDPTTGIRICSDKVQM